MANCVILTLLAGCSWLALMTGAHTCRPGYEAPYHDYCYKFVKSATNWWNAFSSCRRDNSFLVSVETVGEQRHLERYINARPHLKYPGYHTSTAWGYWTSGSDQGNEGVWTWMSTGRLMTYKDFLPNEPNNAGGDEHCLDLVMDSWKWNDKECYARISFICESKA